VLARALSRLAYRRRRLVIPPPRRELGAVPDLQRTAARLRAWR
jgi:hypothetical protein